MAPSANFFEDGNGRGGPNEGLWIDIVIVEILLDGGLEFGNVGHGLRDETLTSASEHFSHDIIDIDPLEPAPLVGEKLGPSPDAFLRLSSRRGLSHEIRADIDGCPVRPGDGPLRPARILRVIKRAGVEDEMTVVGRLVQRRRWRRPDRARWLGGTGRSEIAVRLVAIFASVEPEIGERLSVIRAEPICPAVLVGIGSEKKIQT